MAAKTGKPKTPTVTPMRVPAHGRGALRVGGTNKGGPGRLPDAVRAQMRELGAAKSLPFLSELLDGKVSVSLLGKCEACEHEQALSEEWVEMIMQRLKASVDQRLKAAEQTFKYGLQSKELVIASGNAASFFDCVHRAIVEEHGEQAAESIKTRAIALLEAVA